MEFCAIPPTLYGSPESPYERPSAVEGCARFGDRKRSAARFFAKGERLAASGIDHLALSKRGGTRPPVTVRAISVRVFRIDCRAKS